MSTQEELQLAIKNAEQLIKKTEKKIALAKIALAKEALLKHGVNYATETELLVLFKQSEKLREAANESPIAMYTYLAMEVDAKAFAAFVKVRWDEGYSAMFDNYGYYATVMAEAFVMGAWFNEQKHVS